MTANVAYGEAPPIRIVETKLKSEQIAEIVKQGAVIYSEVKESKIEPMDHDGNEALLKRLQDSHKDFNTSFPLVLRWMVQIRQFDEKVFTQFLNFYKKNAGGPNAMSVFPTREKFLEVQAEYLVLMYRATHPRLTGDEIRTYRKNIVDQLMKEDKEFLDTHAEVEKERKALEEEANKRRRAALYEFLRKRKAALEATMKA